MPRTYQPPLVLTSRPDYDEFALQLAEHLEKLEKLVQNAIEKSRMKCTLSKDKRSDML